MASYSDDARIEAELDRQIADLMRIPSGAGKKIANEILKSPNVYLHKENNDNWVMYVEWRGLIATFWGMTADRARTRAEEWLKKVGYYTPEDEN